MPQSFYFPPKRWSQSWLGLVRGLKRLKVPRRCDFDSEPPCDYNERRPEPLLHAAAAPVDGGSAGASMVGQPADCIDVDERRRVSQGA
ncbi:hypothetical protein NHQ30_010533 [Ciborinia camelliae]|nr:hypothetical protein NHQ30_010533 [Ciborinia camelliae]